MNLGPIRYFYKKQNGMVVFPRAKINIGLRITGRRSDGYHDLQTIFYPVGLSDALEFIVPEEKISDDIITITGKIPDGNPAENLVIKALLLLRELHPVPFLKLHLHKVIPAGAGLGGGSSDAASFLKALNRHFNLQIGNEDLKKLALKLGSDCPFFIDNIPSFAEGRGEILSPLLPRLQGMHISILKPHVSVSTREAFEGCIPAAAGSDLRKIYDGDPGLWKETLRNDFEKTVFPKHNEISFIKEALYGSGALYSSMSGSGSAVYGIFRDNPVLPEDISRLVVFTGML